MERILGQPYALNTIRAVLRSGRVHHAWIFSGPHGVGKCTTAIELARILLDPQAAPNLAGEIEADPAGRTARLIDEGTHPDLHVIRKELALYSDNPDLRTKKLMNIPLDLLRERMIGGMSGGRYHEAAAYRTAQLGHGKVFIIDEAELLDQNTQNAILKTLEEPPPRTYIFLITSQPERLLPTIRSRCQHVRFGPLSDEAMEQWFARSSLEIDADQRGWIERLAQGSPGVAQLAAEYGFYEWRATLEPMLQRLEEGVYPAEMGDTLAKLIDDFAVAWVKNHDNASKDAANKAGARHVLALLASFATTKMRAALAEGDDPEPWLRALDVLGEAEAQLLANVNLKHLLDNLVAQWARSARRAVTA